MFIAIEGPDGSGKTTVAELLTRRLQQMTSDPVFRYSNPGTTQLGATIRGIVKDANVPLHATAQALLFAAAHVDLASRIVRDVGNVGHAVCDRWYYSSLAYQGSQGVDIDLLAEVIRAVDTIIKPDAVIYLRADVTTSLNRICGRGGSAQDRYESMPLNYKHSVLSIFDHAAERGKMHRIDTDRKSVTEVLEHVMAYLITCPNFPH